jgi:hypothetical protein
VAGLETTGHYSQPRLGSIRERLVISRPPTAPYPPRVVAGVHQCKFSTTAAICLWYSALSVSCRQRPGETSLPNVTKRAYVILLSEYLVQFQIHGQLDVYHASYVLTVESQYLCSTVYRGFSTWLHLAVLNRCRRHIVTSPGLEPFSKSRVNSRIGTKVRFACISI